MRVPVMLALASLAACGRDGGGLGRWFAAPPVLGGPVQETAVVAIAGRIYVIGGFHDGAGETTSVRVYDVAAGIWSDGPELPVPLHHANATVANGTIYIVGYLSGGFTARGRVWSWDPKVGGDWIERAPLPGGSERGAAVAATLGGKIHVLGGLRGGSVADVSIYDPVGDTWNPGPPLPAPRDHACAGVIGERLFFVGGRNDGAIAANLYELAPGGDGWVERTPMPTARGGIACGVLDGKLIVVGGEGNPHTATGVFPQAESYDPTADAWTPLAPMPTPRHGMGAAAWDGALYVPGGATVEGIGATDVHEYLVP